MRLLPILALIVLAVAWGGCSSSLEAPLPSSLTHDEPDKGVVVATSIPIPPSERPDLEPATVQAIFDDLKAVKGRLEQLFQQLQDGTLAPIDYKTRIDDGERPIVRTNIDGLIITHCGRDPVAPGQSEPCLDLQEAKRQMASLVGKYGFAPNTGKGTNGGFTYIDPGPRLEEELQKYFGNIEAWLNANP